jgi:hypothetical protein
VSNFLAGRMSDEIDIEKLRGRLREMNDTELRRLGRDMLDMLTSTADNKNKRSALAIQLDETRAELKRRNDLRDSK